MKKNEKTIDEYTKNGETDLFKLEEDLNINILKFENRHKQVLKKVKEEADADKVNGVLEAINLYASFIEKFDTFLR